MSAEYPKRAPGKCGWLAKSTSDGLPLELKVAPLAPSPGNIFVQIAW